VNWILCLIVIFVGFLTPSNLKAGKWANCYITTRPHPGRYGDQLILYAKAKFIAETYGIPFLYKPFTYSNQLCLHMADQKYTDKAVRKLKVVSLQKASSLTKVRAAKDTLYLVGFFTHADGISPLEHKKFVTDFRRLISPREKVQLVDLPPGRLSIAVHVRRGGGYPLDVIAQHFFKSKFLSDEFYIKGIQEIIKANPRRPLYVYIFTDDQDPGKMVEKYRKFFKRGAVVFDYRKGENRHDLNVLDDFFAMTKFDCLVRSASSFSRVAEILGSFKMVVSPSGVHRNVQPSQRLVRVFDTLPTMSQLAGVLNLFASTRSLTESLA